MIYIEKIIIETDNKRLPFLHKHDELICNSLNLLVGNQGCGKSTLLNMIYNTDKSIKLQLSTDTIVKGVKSYIFDTEKDNPRTKDIQDNRTNLLFRNAVTSMFKSHGETLYKYTIEPLNKSKDCVILLDEPESGLSIPNQFKLIDSIYTALDNNCQLFIATHCYPLIQKELIYNMEEKNLMLGSDYINNY